MFDLEQFSEDHPELGYFVEEVRGLRDHVIQEYRYGTIDEPLAARLLIVEPHVLRTLGGRILAPASREVVEAPNVAEKPSPPKDAPTPSTTADKVLAAATKLARGSDVCPPHAELIRVTGLKPGTLSATISKLRARGEWRFKSRKPPGKSPAAGNRLRAFTSNGKVVVR